jgi:beta-lactam-binding protein with PASTA domain/tRNA A-37 threonylcarbamoyl transferase component Bud32
MTQPRLLGGRYELDGVVGRGGMAEVYRARDLRLDRVVAVKTLREDLARDQTFQARFRREAQSAASLNHPSIVAVYDTGEDNAGPTHVPFIVMEYVDGRTIRDLLRDDRRLLPERALEITDGVLRALDYSHRAGIVHRDIKPGNVMLNRQGEIKVMDFGIARALSDAQATMTQTAQVIGTAQYLSPEQARGERVDARSDLYSVGCLLYELLTGRPPFTGDSPVSIAYQHVRENPIPPTRVDPELPPWADAIVLRAMEKDAADRYQSAAEMRTDIQRALSGFPVAPVPMPQGGGYGGPGTRRMDPMGQTQLQGQTGGIPPYQYGPPDDGQGRGGRRKRPIWPWIAAVVALIVIGAIVLAYSTLTSNGSGTGVPSVVSMKLSTAEAKLRSAGFKIGPTHAVTSSTNPANTVQKTVPASGTIEPKGTPVTIYYYAAPGARAIPPVAGETVAQATATLTKAGFHNINPVTTAKPSLSVADNHVISTTPPVGKRVPPTTQITLVVSEGGTKVPFLTNDTKSLASSTLSGQGLGASFQVLAPPPGSTFAPGTVWKTTPGANKVVAPGSTITVYLTPGSSSTSPPPTSPSPSSSPSPSPSSSGP